MKAETLLTLLIVAGLVLGAMTGQLLFDPTWSASQPAAAHAYGTLLQLFEFFGLTVFLGLLKMLIMPLIAGSVFCAVCSVGDIRALGRLGGWTLVYYFSTMAIAVGVGIFVVLLVRPGDGVHFQAAGASVVPEAAREVAAGGIVGVLRNLVSLMIPENILAAMAAGQTLGVIVFFLFFGAVTAALGERVRPLVRAAEALTDVVMKMVELVLWFAPLGIFSLLAWTVGRIGLGSFTDTIGRYVLTVLFGLGVHALFVLPGLMLLLTRSNPFRFAYQMRAALLMAVGTSSSSATLPVTLEAATTEAGLSRRSAGLVLPLGATVNMDGTALYEAVAVIFMAQAVGIELGIAQLLIVMLTATLAAIGAAGIPSAGLVTMFIVVDAVNQSLTAANPAAIGIPVAAVGLILGVDRLLDMVRTGVNVWGDAVGAFLIDRLVERRV
ncbi:MAG: dicarboxylate/amino acid:cation symporter [Bdellovibrionales bacterium]|nr:dicarboxylate/amino acid:cation symporter [Bdellovibrionales bacterium]